MKSNIFIKLLTFFSKNQTKVVYNFEKFNYIQPKFIIIDTFTKNHHKDVSQHDKFLTKKPYIHVKFKENFSNNVKVYPRYHP